jgi:hypothetical protein
LPRCTALGDLRNGVTPKFIEFERCSARPAVQNTFTNTGNETLDPGSRSVTVELLDPATMNDRDWPAGSEGVRAFVEAICGHGSEKFVSNVRTRMMVLCDGDVAMPVTINDTEYENSYVCSTLTYTRYMKDELEAIDNPFVRRVIASALDGAGAIVLLARLNKIVQVNNWLVSTNPYPLNWSPNLVSMTDALVAAFPDHAICFRSLNEWANQAMIKELAETGYKLAAYRQIYVFDRLSETYWVHGNVKKDHRLLHRTTYRVVRNNELEEEDFPRMTKLYEMLYLQKHSMLNPAFTPDYMRLCHARGIMRFFGLRHPSGRLDGMFGMLVVARTTPLPSILGYDTSLDDRIGLSDDRCARIRDRHGGRMEYQSQQRSGGVQEKPRRPTDRGIQRHLSSASVAGAPVCPVNACRDG